MPLQPLWSTPGFCCCSHPWKGRKFSICSFQVAIQEIARNNARSFIGVVLYFLVFRHTKKNQTVLGHAQVIKISQRKSNKASKFDTLRWIIYIGLLAFFRVWVALLKKKSDWRLNFDPEGWPIRKSSKGGLSKATWSIDLVPRYHQTGFCNPRLLAKRSRSSLLFSTRLAIITLLHGIGGENLNMKPFQAPINLANDTTQSLCKNFC